MFPDGIEPDTGLLVRNTDSEAQFTYRIRDDVHSEAVPLTPELREFLGPSSFVWIPRERWAEFGLPRAGMRPVFSH